MACAEGDDGETEQRQPAKRGRKPAPRKAVTEVPKQVAAPAKSTAHKAATEVPKETTSAEAVEGEVVSAPVRFQPSHSYQKAT